jgi:sec-independent protein translocase protein TatC
MSNNLSFWEHLDELRSVLFKSLAAWCIATIVAFVFKNPLFAFLFAPSQADFILYRGLRRLAQWTRWETLCPEETTIHFINTELTTPFFTHLQVAMFTGLLIALPLVIWWLYGFIAPALYKQEKKYCIIFSLTSILLFLLGVFVSYILIFPLSFRFLGSYQVTPLVVNQISLSSYISLLFTLCALMGMLFEVPIVTWFLARMGIIQKNQLRHYRRHVFVATLIVAAVITPTGDPFTLLLVTAPVYMLYELSIAIIK